MPQAQFAIATHNRRTPMRFVKLNKIIWLGAIALGIIINYPVQGKEPTVSAIRLNSAEVTQKRKLIPEWSLEDQSLQRTFQFKNFVEAIAFVNRLVEPAEKLAHHPDLAISYNKVTVTLTSHDAGGLTDADFTLAQQINRLAP